ncbi:GGDEF domain-containing protein [Paracoccus sp. TOH]|uniref:GGDEF domain-containing protein n=1 Tax=Paracoccus sp. TOH TaxID=1263728 RepID=UPI0025B15A39|nr:GGDEF domain-containing protein [Paracoccus sp. TOH]WJS85756.1 GGDEF domain-containing protein [Paracoccus sp. TOH]
MNISLACLDELMPMHLVLGPDGRILSTGRTLSKLLNGKDKLPEAFRGDVERILLERSGRNLRPVSLQSHPGISLVAHCARSGDTLILNFGFGASLENAARSFDLTNSDFPPTDLAMECFFLQEANRAISDELHRVNQILKEARDAAERLSVTDPLTGALNKRAFDLELAAAMENAQRAPFSLMSLDLDSFKLINDTFGHIAGDSVLVAAANALRSQIRDEDKMCRVGGDEFLIVIRNCADRSTLLKMAKRILSAIDEIRPLGFPANLSASLGISTSEQCRTVHDLLSGADVALYRSKRAGGGRATIFDAS